MSRQGNKASGRNVTVPLSTFAPEMSLSSMTLSALGSSRFFKQGS
jgi:hypothetical protein